MNIRILLFLTTVFFFETTSAQSDFRKGFIIKANNDTVYGYIYYAGNKANAEQCLFKQTEKSVKEIFTPDLINSYRFIDGKYYVSKTVNTGEQAEKVFLEYLINGVVDIYYYRKNGGEHYLVDNGDGVLTDLKNEKKEVIENNTKYQKDSKEYIGILRYTFMQSPSTVKEVEKVRLNHHSLIDITKDYHQEVCTDKECIIYEKKITKVKHTFGPIVGLNTYTLSGGKNFPDYNFLMENSDYNTSVYPSIGIYYQANMPELYTRLSFLYEGTYSKWSLKTQNSYYHIGHNVTYNSDISVTRNVFGNTMLLSYKIPKRNLCPVFQAGAFLSYFFKTDYLNNLEITGPSGDTYPNQQLTEDPFSKLEYGLNVGIGLIGKIRDKREYSLNIRYQLGFGIYPSLSSNHFAVNLGLQLGK